MLPAYLMGGLLKSILVGKCISSTYYVQYCNNYFWKYKGKQVLLLDSMLI